MLNLLKRLHPTSALTNRIGGIIMKRILISVLTFIMIFASLTSCICKKSTNVSEKEATKCSFDTLPNQSNYLRLEDISAKKVVKKDLKVTGETINAEKTSRGLFTLSIDQDSGNSYLSFFNTENDKLWDYKFDTVIDQIKLTTDEYVLIHTRQGLLAIDYNGKESWSGEKFQEDFRDTAYFSDNNGGVFVLGQDDSTSEHACMLYRISGTGEVLSCKPYDRAGNISPIQVFNGLNNDYWLLGTSNGGTDIRFLAHLDSELNVDKKFNLKENQYPNVMLIPEQNSIILYGQAYKDNFKTEYGFIYVIGLNCSQKAYKTFDTLPRSVIQMKDGRWIVSLSDRGNTMKDLVKVFDADWNEIKSVNIFYAFTELYVSDDGGFIITGLRLAPGQGYQALSTDIVRPKMDTIYERYDSDGRLIYRETFFAEKSVYGNGYFSQVFYDGTLYLM